MRIRLWNAFASNNSGSYTIVGTFRDPAVAAAVAKELQAVCDAESDWQRGESEHARSGESPWVAFVRELGVPDANASDDTGDDWPDLAYAQPPKVTHTHRQVVLHVPYTVTMPREIGLFLYHRGGRVDVELDHAHEAIVVDHQLWGAWSDPQRDQRLRDALAALLADGSVLRQHAAEGVEPVVQLTDEHGTIVRALAVFADVVAGVAAMAQLASAHGLELYVRVREAEPGDPLRPWRSG